ncbi:MAG: hypothetical protein KF774_10810 [Planctomyces sp.]|nr:hypothetical protein [Planctomyces sp.]
MRISTLTAIHARIPLKRQVRHASHTRSENDALLVRCELDDGGLGWGEGLPRPYVTGETIDSAWRQFAESDFEASLGGRFADLPDVIARLENWHPTAAADDPRDRLCNAFRCAVELAVLDAVCRRLQRPLSDAVELIAAESGLAGPRDRVQYSAAISSTALPKAMLAARMYRHYGFEFCKLKVGAEARRDGLLARCVRLAAGSRMDLRVDANEAWTPQSLPRHVDRLRPARISAIEQPLPHEHVGALARLRPGLGVPIALDESLCSEVDARRAIEQGLCDLFNIRLSKCGGLIRSLRLARLARDAGLAFQLGCQVGETGLLSAAGRHWACSVAGLAYLEGSFDRILVAERLIVEDITFRRGGWGARLTGPGLGVTVDGAAIERVGVRRAERRLG